MELYINGLGCISPQQTHNKSRANRPELVKKTGYTCIEPEYAHFIAPQQLRRMSRVLKMGYHAARLALNDCGCGTTEAIVTGTGLGCLADTEKFLSSMTHEKSTVLSPTPFIHSTHNSIASQIAIQLKCHGYNSTFSSRGFSFESALLDAYLQIKEQAYTRVLAGAVDETTALTLSIAKKFGINNAGEGAVFFSLSPHNINSYAKITIIKQLFDPQQETPAHTIQHLLSEHGLDTGDIDIILTGTNYPEQYEQHYNLLLDTLFSSSNIAYYKHLCGEYFTSSAFALWLACQILHHQYYPESIRYKHKKTITGINRILIYNTVGTTYHSIMLVEHV